MKRHCSSPDISLPAFYHESPQRATPPSPSLSRLHLAYPIRESAHTQWTDKARSIAGWIASGPSSYSSTESCHTPEADDMSDGSRLREKKRRSRSCSPTKKSPQYRAMVLKPANILVDVVHDLPSEIEPYLPAGLRNVLDSSAPVMSATSLQESEVGESFSEAETSQLAAVYRDMCRELAAESGSEPEYKSHLFQCIVKKLASASPYSNTFRADMTEKLWCSSLKPSAPRITLPWLSLSKNAIYNKAPGVSPVGPTQDSLDSQNARMLPEISPSDSASRPMGSVLSDDSELEDAISTPKPDITVGISHNAFTPLQSTLLKYWQLHGMVFSDPHVTQGDTRFPFFFVEAKGLATSGNLIGAQNQAAGGGACAIRLLDSLGIQEPTVDVPRTVFSLTTEGAIHELWVHYRLSVDGSPRYHMTCLATWRVTLARHAREFVAALAVIFRWGAEVFYPKIKQLLDQVLLV